MTNLSTPPVVNACCQKPDGHAAMRCRAGIGDRLAAERSLYDNIQAETVARAGVMYAARSGGANAQT